MRAALDVADVEMPLLGSACAMPARVRTPKTIASSAAISQSAAFMIEPFA
jgi:hypothetical protein